MKKHLMHYNNNHHKFSINPHRVGVVLLERKGLKETGLIYSLLGLERILPMKSIYLRDM